MKTILSILFRNYKKNKLEPIKIETDVSANCKELEKSEKLDAVKINTNNDDFVTDMRTMTTAISRRKVES